ncbi:MAG: Ig-like domain-containing protein [Fermentimonas sp.]|nr:Ig-like domain-containing protein [Fermentimonas sp.]
MSAEEYAFKATYKDQYKQAINMKPGIYTFQALVMFQSNSPDGKYSISFTDEAGQIYVVNLNWQIEPNMWCEVTQQIELEKTMYEFSLMASPLMEGEVVYIGLPQHEEGNNRSTPRANPLDETEQLQGEIDLVKTYISSQVDFLEDRITLKVGEYRMGGKNLLRNYDGRFGMDYWSAGADPVDETGVAIPVTISSVTAPNPISVYALQIPQVPETIKLWLDNGSSVVVPVTWGSIDTSVVGELEVSGTYDLPEGVVGEKPEVLLKIIVSAVTVVSVVPLTQVAVDQYRKPELPIEIYLNLNDGRSYPVIASWSGYNTNTAGTFELTASYDLPIGVTGYKPTVKITMVVSAVAETGTFVDLKPYLIAAKGPGGFNNGWITGSDENGDYVLINSNEGIITSLSQHLNSSSIIYTEMTYTLGGTRSQLMLYAYANGYPQDASRFWFNAGNRIQDFTSVAPLGTIELISVQFMNVKVYRMELRNDGSVPPWYIQ